MYPALAHVALLFFAVLLLPALGEWCGGKPGDGSGPSGSNSGPCRVDGPRTPADQPAWLAALKADRDATVKKINYTGGVSGVPGMEWTQTAFVQPQMHPYDRLFYDVESHTYTVDAWLADLDDRYGGIDVALVWPTYPNLGIDDRNQFDLFRSLPGGLDGVKDFTRQLKARGVRVMWPYLTWDTGTRRESKMEDDTATIATLLRQTGGVGINGDSIPYLPKAFWTAGEAEGYPLALQAEGGTRDEALNWSNVGWGYWGRQSNPSDAPGYHWTYDTVPLVSVNMHCFAPPCHDEPRAVVHAFACFVWVYCVDRMAARVM